MFSILACFSTRQIRTPFSTRFCYVVVSTEKKRLLLDRAQSIMCCNKFTIAGSRLFSFYVQALVDLFCMRAHSNKLIHSQTFEKLWLEVLLHDFRWAFIYSFLFKILTADRFEEMKWNFCVNDFMVTSRRAYIKYCSYMLAIIPNQAAFLRIKLANFHFPVQHIDEGPFWSTVTHYARLEFITR